LTEYIRIPCDIILTVYDHGNEVCPVFPGNAVGLHQNVPNPANATGSEEEIRSVFIKKREVIKAGMSKMIKSHIKSENHD